MDNERWKRIAGSKGYEISTYGRVRSWLEIGSSGLMTTEPRMLKTHTKKIKGVIFHVVWLSEEGRRREHGVATLVLNAFLGRPEKYVKWRVLFINGNRTDCRLSNLDWVLKDLGRPNPPGKRIWKQLKLPGFEKM